MSSIKSWFLRILCISSPTPPDVAIRGPSRIAPSPLPESLDTQPQAPLQRVYPDYLAGRTGFDTALAISTILNNIPSLPRTIAGPLTQVVDVLSGMMEVVKLMRENQDTCSHLVNRVVRFLQNLVDEWLASDVPILDGTPTAARLIALGRYEFYPHSVFPCLYIPASVVAT